MDELTFEAYVNADHVLRLPGNLPVGSRVRIQVEPLSGEPDGASAAPMTELGPTLLAIRQRAIARGMPLQSADAILAEVREGRAEAGDDQDLR